MMLPFSKWLRKIKSRVSLLAAVWLCFSPFTLGYLGNANASISAFLIATVILLASQLADTDRPHTVEGINIVASVLLIVSPWWFNYSHQLVALINAELSGITILVSSLLSFQNYFKINKPETKSEHHHPT